MAKRILIRRDTTANWNSVNPILSHGEIGIEIKFDGKRSMKLGTGSIPWNSLAYFIDNPATQADLTTHKNDTTAHGATDIPIANRIAMFNSNLGLKSDKIPTDLNDVLRKTELNTIDNTVSGLQYDIDTLELDLASEIDNREADVSGLQYEVNTLELDLESEIDNRETAVSGIKYDISTLELDLLTETSVRQAAISGVIYTASEDATTKANTAEDNAKQYADDLALATQKWIPAVQTSADLPTNPGGGTYLCRVI
jgi:hypothetical protein